MISTVESQAETDSAAEEKNAVSEDGEAKHEAASGESGSGIEGFDPDLDEEFLDMAIDDIL